jgi:hypothetical protein
MQAIYLKSRISPLGCARNARNAPDVKGINRNLDASYAQICAFYWASHRIPRKKALSPIGRNGTN